jgi:uncharacterized protein involved in exopolysaccharide biosynthesis
MGQVKKVSMTLSNGLGGGFLLAVLRARGLWVLAAVVLCLGAAAAYALLAPDRYRALATLFFEPGPAEAGEGSGASSPARNSELDLLRSERVAQRVVENERLMEEPALRNLYMQSIDAGRAPQEALAQYLAQRVEVHAGEDGGLVHLAVTMDDPALAARVANAYAQAWGEVALELRAASIRSGIERASRDLASLRARLGEARARRSGDGALAAAGSRADEQFAQLSRLVSQPLSQPLGQVSSQVAVAGSIAAAAEPARSVGSAVLPADASADLPADASARSAEAAPEQRTARSEPRLADAGGAASAEDEIRLAQQSLERAEERIARLSTQGIGVPFPAHVLRTARVPEESTKASPWICALIGLASGLLLGTLFAFVAESLDRRVRRPSDLVRATGLVVLGSLPLAAAPQGVRLAARKARALPLGAGQPA